MFDTPTSPGISAGVASIPDLECIDLSTLADRELGELISEVERRVARLHAVQLAAVARLGADRCYGADTEQYLREEVSTLCRVGRWEAHRRMVTALQLARLPALRAAFTLGQVHLPQVVATAVELEAVADDGVAAQLAEQLTPDLPRRSPVQARNAAEKLAQAACPQATRVAEFARSCQSLTWVESSAPGRSMLLVDLTNDSAATVARAVDAYAAPTGAHDTRSSEHRRADALVDIARRALREAGSTGLPGRAHLQVIVPIDTVLGGREPGQLPDGRLVGPEAVRRHACDSLLSRLLVDPGSGALLDVGRSQRVVPDRLRRFVLTRDRQCQFPYCARSASRCDIHHIVPWSHGGSTDADNLVLVCSRHHHAVHEAGWWARRQPCGSITWTSPLGHVHLSPPNAYRVPAPQDGPVSPGARSNW
jgi:hypothetical protein